MSIYDRFINNRVLLACRRPQPKKYCAPVTIGEILDILLSKHISTIDIVKQLHWSHDKIIGGYYGTDKIINGKIHLSDNVIKHRILEVTDSESDWNMIKQCIKDGLIFYHAPGHHLIICGFIEEPLINKHSIWNHDNVDKDEYRHKRCSLVKAEHLIKKPEDIDQGMIISLDFREIIKTLNKHPHTNLVYFFT